LALAQVWSVASGVREVGSRFDDEERKLEDDNQWWSQEVLAAAGRP
jgi:hypothetical protein